MFKRWVCEQIAPGDADPHPGAKAIVSGADALPGALLTRRFAAASGETIVLHELSGPEVSLPAGARLYRAYGP